MNPALFQLETIPEPPKIDPVPEGVERPLFSVMIPVCNRIKYLRQTIESVLNENYPPEQMQICIVDNSTEKIDWESFLTPEETSRIEIFRQPEHVGIAENWNTCIRQASGHLVHILHDDDWILPGFYYEIKIAYRDNPNCSLFYTRCFINSEDSSIDSLTARSKNLEVASQNILSACYSSNIMCPSVVVSRKAYELFGGFTSCLCHLFDWEMWLRVIKFGGGLQINKPLANYRYYASNFTKRLEKTAENLHDRLKLGRMIQKIEPDFDMQKFINIVSQKSLQQANEQKEMGNEDGFHANMEVYRYASGRAKNSLSFYRRLRKAVAAFLKEFKHTV
jgi:glycosyltransferase involved in cell wall biosynthesis